MLAVLSTDRNEFVQDPVLSFLDEVWSRSRIDANNCCFAILLMPPATRSPSEFSAAFYLRQSPPKITIWVRQCEQAVGEMLLARIDRWTADRDMFFTPK